MERDVAEDAAAAQEVVNRSGQMGVPVTIADGEIIVGFDRARLETLARTYAAAARPRLGIAGRDTASGGVEVGRVNPGEPAANAGILAGDIIEAVNGRALLGLDDLTRTLDSLTPDTPYDVVILRGGQQQRLRVAW